MTSQTRQLRLRVWAEGNSESSPDLAPVMDRTQVIDRATSEALIERWPLGSPHTSPPRSGSSHGITTLPCIDDSISLSYSDSRGKNTPAFSWGTPASSSQLGWMSVPTRQASFPE